MKLVFVGVLISTIFLPGQLARSFELQTKLIASDAAAGDAFGISTGISNSVAIVGAKDDDDKGDGSGSAYLFDVTTRQELFKLTASDGETGDAFGTSVAIDGNFAVVGAKFDDDLGNGSGAVYLFNVSTGHQLFKWTAGASGGTGNYFGESVAISGNIAIVGERYGDGRKVSSGAAYLFDVTTGQELLKLTASDGDTSDGFGCSVAISGNFAVVGAEWDDDRNSGAGAAYLFDVVTGHQLFKWTAPLFSNASDNFGHSVAISGNVAIVGEPGGDGLRARYGEGAAYLFDITTGKQLFKIFALDGQHHDSFGTSVAISGNTAIVGAFFDDDSGAQSGSAYLFNATTGVQIMKLTAADANAGDFFGLRVAISGDLVIVGARNAMGEGRAYLLIPEPSSFHLIAVAAGLFHLAATRRRVFRFMQSRRFCTGETCGAGDSGFDHHGTIIGR